MAGSSTDDRSLAPTARRLEQARQQGMVPVSRSAVAALSFAFGCLVLSCLASRVAGRLVAYTRVATAEAPKGGSGTAGLYSGLTVVLSIVAWPLAAVCFGALLGGLAQTRGRIWRSPVGGHTPASSAFARWLGRGRAGEVGLDLCKLAALLLVLGASVPFIVGLCARLPQARPLQMGQAVAAMLLRLGAHLAVAMVVLGSIDYLWQLLRQRRALRMSHDEARREERENEGDPELKAERRRLHGLLHVAGDLVDLAGADVVVIEAGWGAAAIGWRGGGVEAPVLIARGSGPRAQRIERSARQAGIPIYLDPGLVRTLAFLNEGDGLPAALWAAVARLAARARSEAPELGDAEPRPAHGIRR
jgi:flagellar biosynthesis protein FlhB